MNRLTALLAAALTALGDPAQRRDLPEDFPLGGRQVAVVIWFNRKFDDALHDSVAHRQSGAAICDFSQQTKNARQERFEDRPENRECCDERCEENQDLRLAVYKPSG